MRVVVSALISIEGKYLLCLRGAGVYPFFWELPTVELDYGDTIEDSLETFLFSELGLRVGAKKFRGKLTTGLEAEACLHYLIETEVVGGRFSLGMYQDASFVNLNKVFRWNLTPHTLLQLTRYAAA